MTSAPRYPIEEILPAVLASLVEHSRLVLEAPPGAGKTTQVPVALLQSAWCTGKVLMLEPRRIAARAAAAFMAAQLNEAVGETVGYRIRFERKVTARTRIENRRRRYLKIACANLRRRCWRSSIGRAAVL